MTKIDKSLILKSRLTKEELKELAENTKDRDPKLSHYLAYRTMMNGTRREILLFIGCEVRSMVELKDQFSIDMEQLNYHLSMLEQCYYIINSSEGWKSTPLGLGFLDNAKLGDH